MVQMVYRDITRSQAMNDDFEDWIDDLYGFMHMINPPPHLTTRQANLAIFAEDVADIESTSPPKTPLSYNNAPREPKAQFDDACINHV